jgi:hypothetical protein
MRYLFLFIFALLSACTSGEEQSASGNSELWVMVKIDSNFRSHQDLKLIDLVTERIESKKLGFLDGHSSGAYQLDFNFVDIKDIDAARTEIVETITTSYPSVEYTVSTIYEAKYEKL